MNQQQFSDLKDSLFFNAHLYYLSDFKEDFAKLLNGGYPFDINDITRERGSPLLTQTLQTESDKHSMYMTKSLVDIGAKLIDYSRYYQTDTYPNYRKYIPLHCLMYWFSGAGCSKLYQNIDLFRYILERVSWEEFTTIKNAYDKTALDRLTGGIKGKDKEQKWNKPLIDIMNNMKAKDEIGSKRIKPSFLEARTIKKLKKQYDAKLSKTQTAVRDIAKQLAEAKKDCVVITL